jgi:hypothetical protein
MRSKASYDWLPSYIQATRPVLEIFKMAGYFPDSPRTLLAQQNTRRHVSEDCCLQSLTSAPQTSLTFHYYITAQVMNIRYFPANNRTHAFTLSGNTQGQNAVSSATGTLGGNPCNADWLIIPCAANIGRTGQSTCVDRICGGTLNAEISITPTSVISKDVTHKTNVPWISNLLETYLNLYLLNSFFKKKAPFPILILLPLNKYAHNVFLT